MVSHQIVGLRLLIVEDEYYLADDARAVLAALGANILGPVATVTEAQTFIEAESDIDAVLLDVNLRGEMAYDVADVLQARAVPFAFVTGYDFSALPKRFLGTPRLDKPVDSQQLVKLVERLTMRDSVRAIVKPSLT